MFAFSMLFYLQLGSSVDNFYSTTYAVLALTRSLFGDFHFAEIVENSNTYAEGVDRTSLVIIPWPGLPADC